MQSWNHSGCLHLANCHRNSTVTNHPSYTHTYVNVCWCGKVRRTNYPFAVFYFYGRSSSNFKPLGFLLQYSSCCPTQLINTMTAFHLYGFCHCQTIKSGFHTGCWKVSGAQKKSTEANWPNKLVFCTAFPGPQSTLLMKGSRILPWRWQGFAKTHFKLVNHQAKTLLPTPAAKSVLAAQQRTAFYCTEIAGFRRLPLTTSEGKNTFYFSNTITCQTDFTKPKSPSHTDFQIKQLYTR